jgi:prevent-host-death family protein
MIRMTATEASRTFSDVLDRVVAGEEIEVTRGGVTVATIAPPRVRLMSAERLTALLETAPPVDAAFADDVRAARAALDHAPEGDPWAS